MIIILAIIILPICCYFIYMEFQMNDKLILFGIVGSTLLLYFLLHLIVPVVVPPNYASDLLGASFPVELLICAVPSILILGIAGIVKNIIWKLKKRSR